MKKRILCICLALLLLLGTLGLLSCNRNNNEGDDSDNGADTIDNSSSDVSDVEEVDERKYYQDTFGDIDMKGKEVWVYDLNTSPDIHINYYDNLKGDKMNVALYKRDMLFEEIYGIKMEYFQSTQGSTVVSNAVLSGTYLADIIYGRASGGRLMTLAQQGCLSDMMSNTALDFSQPWWGNFMTESLTVNNKLYFTSGDILPTFYQSIGCFFYNMDLGKTYGIDKEALCQTVMDGNFTWEYMTKLVKDADTNLDSNLTLTADKDQFGLITYNVYNHTNMWAIGAGLKLVEQNATGQWIVDFESPNVVATLADLARYITYTEMGDNGLDSIMQTTFKSGRAIFAEHFTESAFSTLRNMENDYLMLPVPKLYDHQESYRCMVNSYVNCFVGILSNCADPEITGAILESQAHYGYNYIRPIAYEEFLKLALSRDVQAAALVDIIFDTAYIDYGVIEKFGKSDKYSDGASTILYQYLKEGKPLTSAFASNKDAINGSANEALGVFTTP